MEIWHSFNAKEREKEGDSVEGREKDREEDSMKLQHYGEKEGDSVEGRK